MTTWTLLKRSFSYYRRTHLPVLLGAAAAVTVLVGALVIGDSVNYTLKRTAQMRLGRTKLALMGNDRFFRPELARELALKLSAQSAAVLYLPSSLANHDGSQRVNRVEVLGVDDNFWQLGPNSSSAALGQNEIALNEPLAQRLKVKLQDEVLLRVSKPSLLPRAAPLSTVEDNSIALRLKVTKIVSEKNFGAFSLQANQLIPCNAFLNRDTLSKMVDLPDKANLMLITDGSTGPVDISRAQDELKSVWQLADAGLELRKIPAQHQLELRSSRIFLEEPIVEAALKTGVKPYQVLTYLVNELRSGNNTTPYSMVSALEKSPATQSIIPADMNDDQIVFNSWLADDLQAHTGDYINMTYFVLGPMRKLQQRASRFRVHAVTPIKGMAADPDLMPQFPGLAQVENCRDWQPGIPIDLNKIRDKDEQYWDKYRGTPKAFITLAAGQRMWGNRFGKVTALRYPLAGNNRTVIENTLLQKLNPAQLGLFFRPVANLAQKAGSQAQDFGQLFLGLSFFVIAAALLLTGLLFVFGVEQRSEEMGLLAALGFTQKRIRRFWLWEGMILALGGALLGTAGAVAYTKVMLYALATVWSNALADTTIYLHLDPGIMITGAVVGVATALSAMLITLFIQARKTPRELLTHETEPGLLKQIVLRKKRLGLWFGSITGGSAAALVYFGLRSSEVSPGLFFGAGALLLLAALFFSAALLNKLTTFTSKAQLTLSSLAVRNTTRRRGRSLAVIALLACGCFIIIAVGANRKDPLANSKKRSSGTGGFSLIAETTLPIYYDLNSNEGRKALSLVDDDLKDMQVVPFRVRAGDDASCLNLNRPQTPRIIAVQPGQLARRGAFSFTNVLDVPTNSASAGNPWLLLEKTDDQNVIPALADAATIKWALGKSLGDTLQFIDDQGQKFQVRLVGALADSILQGSVIISENEFNKRFPSQDGYQMFLIDCPPTQSAQVSQYLTRSLRNFAWQSQPTVQKLASFFNLENTYLSIFQLLGGLGLILGGIGLGLVLLRNVMERRSEFALMRALGFTPATLRQLIFREHWTILALGLFGGVIAALVAVWPALQHAGTQIPYSSLLLTLVAIGINGILWIWLAARSALRGELLGPLRNE